MFLLLSSSVAGGDNYGFLLTFALVLIHLAAIVVFLLAMRLYYMFTSLIIYSSFIDMMQGAYFLCRLFHKPDEKADSSNYDQVQPSGSSPTTVKSSPDEPSSDLFQESSILDFQVGKQPEGIKRWLTDKSDDVTSDSFLHVRSCTSHVEGCLTEAATTDVRETFGKFRLCARKLLSPGFFIHAVYFRYIYSLEGIQCVMNPQMILIARSSPHYCHTITQA